MSGVRNGLLEPSTSSKARPTVATVVSPRVGEVLAAVESIERERKADSPGAAEDGPIFVLATGWRTGSTLVQRILLSDPRVLVWGEPLGRMGLIPRMTEALCSITESWPPEKYLASEELSDLTGQWVANLFPPLTALRSSWRALIREWLAAPARARGFSRWGLKEVRLSGADACLLRWLFPRARFVLLTRDPCQAYRSVLHSGHTLPYWDRWPDRPVGTAGEFGDHWNRIACSFEELPDDFSCRTVKYEDLVGELVDFRDLEAFLGLRLQERKALSVKVGVSKDAGVLAEKTRTEVLRSTRTGRQAFGYRGRPA